MAGPHKDASAIRHKRDPSSSPSPRRLRPAANHPSLPPVSGPFTFYEFFAGGGMARAGLGEGWDCLFANDFDKVKTETYRANWGGDHLHQGDVWALTADRLPGRADLAWASSPCQDLSLAGKRARIERRTLFGLLGVLAADAGAE